LNVTLLSGAFSEKQADLRDYCPAYTLDHSAA